MHRAFFTFAAFITESMMEGCPGHLVHLVNSATKRCPSSAAISFSSNSNSPSCIYITPPDVAVSFVTSRRRRLVAGLVPGTTGLVPGTAGLGPAGLCRHPPLLESSLPYLQRIPRSSPCAQFAKFRNAPQTKMADVDSNIQHRQVTLKNHCT